MNRRTQHAAATLCFWSSGAFIALLLLLHLIRSDLDPSWRFISEYELGPFGWLMRLAFVSLAVSCLSLAASLQRQAGGMAGVLGLALLWVTAAGMTLAALYAPDKVNRLHEIGAMLDNLPFAAVLINWRLGMNERWQGHRRTLILTGGLPLMGLAFFIGAMAAQLPSHGGKPGPEVLVGWPNRIMILLHCAWLMPVAYVSARIPAVRNNTGKGLEGGEAAVLA